MIMKDLSNNLELCKELFERSLTKQKFFIGIGDNENIPLKNFFWVSTHDERLVQENNYFIFYSQMTLPCVIMFFDKEKLLFVERIITKKFILDFRTLYENPRSDKFIGSGITIDELCDTFEKNLDRTAKLLIQNQ
jgi:hypothetical protein